MQDPVLELDVTLVDLTFPFYMVWSCTVEPYTNTPKLSKQDTFPPRILYTALMRSPHYSFPPHWCLERGSTVYLSAPYLYENKPDGFYIAVYIQIV